MSKVINQILLNIQIMLATQLLVAVCVTLFIYSTSGLYLHI